MDLVSFFGGDMPLRASNIEDQERLLALRFRESATPPEGPLAFSWKGLSAQHVDVIGPTEFSFQWSGTTHYLALHNIRKLEGETVVDGLSAVRTLDVRDRMTFVPSGCGVSDWTRLSGRANAFTALYYDPKMIPEELDRVPRPTTPAPWSISRIPVCDRRSPRFKRC